MITINGDQQQHFPGFDKSAKVFLDQEKPETMQINLFLSRKYLNLIDILQS